ncbi:hypothetical protein ABMA28_005393 [Loxostege sticticalis]|uniref:Uncharacterized protein n=1 Tax=Loxostege sticticalis TaxID=481309 RepID=A0ABD0SQ98_LOXSC
MKRGKSPGHDGLSVEHLKHAGPHINRVLSMFFALGSYSALRVQYNNTFRALLRLPRYCSASGMFADAAVDDFYAIMRKKVTSLVRRVMGSGNQVLKMIADRMDAAVFRRYTELHVLHVVR